MSRDYNRVILIGRLARDPEVKTTQGGAKTARFSLATGREWKDKVTGEKRTETDFHSVQAWGPIAGTFEQYVHKGDKVLVEGRLHSYSYDGRDGTKKYAVDVIVENMLMLGSKGAAQGQAAGASAPSAPRQAQARYYDDGADMGSLRSEAGFEEEFPLDFSELSPHGGAEDVEIPF